MDDITNELYMWLCAKTIEAVYL